MVPPTPCSFSFFLASVATSGYIFKSKDSEPGATNKQQDVAFVICLAGPGLLLSVWYFPVSSIFLKNSWLQLFFFKQMNSIP